MEEIIKEIRELKKDIAKLNERLIIYTKETENSLKILSNKLNDKLEDVKREVKVKIKKANARIEERKQ